jgi:hypothetical protein
MGSREVEVPIDELLLATDPIESERSERTFHPRRGEFVGDAEFLLYFKL